MNYRTIPQVMLVGAALSVAIPVLAQTAAVNSHNPAVKSSRPAPVAAPARGANSFTRSQAHGRLAKAGYSNVSHLVKDPTGAWAASAMKDGKKVMVALDYKGNITTR